LIGKLVRLFLLLLVLAVGLAGGAVYWGFTKFHEPGPAAVDNTVMIERGLGVRGIADKLADAGVITDPLVFAAGVRVYGEERPLQAGEYLFPARRSMREIMEQMIAGGTIVHRLTIPEGLTSVEIVALVAAAPDLDGSMPAEMPADGSLLPETYFFSRGDTRAQLLARMRKGMTDALASLPTMTSPRTVPETAGGLVVSKGGSVSRVTLRRNGPRSPRCSSTGWRRACRCNRTRLSSMRLPAARARSGARLPMPTCRSPTPTTPT
jgi:UPF0755 protein